MSITVTLVTIQVTIMDYVAVHYILKSFYLFFTCVAVDCGSLSINHGAIVTEATSLGSVAQYSCESGYALVGGDNRTCEANGMWSGEEPLCIMTSRSSPPHIAGQTPSSLIGETTPQLPQETPIPTSSVGARCQWDDSGSGGELICNSKTAPSQLVQLSSIHV